MSTRIAIEMDETKLRELVSEHLRDIGLSIESVEVKIEVKTKSNYRTAEWEPGQFRARVEVVR